MHGRGILVALVFLLVVDTYAASSQYPNEPSGFTPFAEWDASVRLKYAAQTYPGVLGKWYECPSPCGGTAQNNNPNFWQTVDPTAPQSPQTVMVTRFPRGHQGGAAPGNLGGWDATGKEYDQIYFSLWLKINDTNGDGMYENHPVLTKMGWTGSGDAPATAANQNFYVLLGGSQIPSCTNSPNAPFNPNNLYCNNQASAFRVGVYQQGPVLNGIAMHRNMGQNQNTQPLMTVGSWHHWEAVWKISTPGSAAPCASNPSYYCGDGAIAMWIDGVLTMNYTDVALNTPTATHAFTNYYWNPTWGGSNTTWRNYEDSMLIDHIYISGVPKGSSPTPAQCGNGVIESGEQCDGTALGSGTCANQGFTGGTLSCSATCTYVTSACTSADTTNPTVSFSTPASGATVSATTSITATATDNVAVQNVQFRIDGTTVSTDTTSPYSYSWDTTTATNAQHTLTIIATDTSGNTATATRTVTVNNAAPAQCGNGAIEGTEQCDLGGSNGACPSLCSATCTTNSCSSPTVLLRENFEDNQLLTRAWYDTPNGLLSTVEKVPGSAASMEYRFLQGATSPTLGKTARHLFTASDSVYVSYWIKYSSNWVGSQKSYHPHQFHFTTSLDSNWVGPSITKSTFYIEENAGYPMISQQDALNIDQARINQNLISTTETRAVAGCNGNAADGATYQCYPYGTPVYTNAKTWKSSTKWFSDSTGATYKGDWHFIETYIKLNTVQNGVGIADGTAQYWYDGQSVINAQNVVFRTGANPTMKLNQFIIAPYIGDGSPVQQSFFIDNLTIMTSRPGSYTPPAQSCGNGAREGTEQCDLGLGNGACPALCTAGCVTQTCQKTGDLNGDGKVDIIDVQRIVTKLGTSSSTGEDINGDGTVNLFDLVRLAQNWG